MYANAQNTDPGMRMLVRRWMAQQGRIDMNRDRFHGICRQLGGTVQQCWGALTGDPVTLAAGTRVRLAGRVQEQRGIARQEADRQLEDFLSRHRHWQDVARR